MSTSVPLPIIICAKERLADLIPAVWWRSGKAIIACTVIIFVFRHGVLSTFDMGRSIGFGVEQHVGMETIILMKNVLADDGAFPP